MSSSKPSSSSNLMSDEAANYVQNLVRNSVAASVGEQLLEFENVMEASIEKRINDFK